MGKNRSDSDLKRIKFSSGYGLDLGKVTNRELAWYRLAGTLTTPTRDQNLTHAQYLKLDADGQAAAKCGSFVVGGHCKDGRRKRENVEKRYFLNLDVDNATPEQFQIIKDGLSEIFGYACAIHTTRSHTPEKPKFRVFFPLAKPVDEERFIAASRIIASKLFETVEESMDAVDEVSFRPAQLMYLPSVSRDQDYWSQIVDGPLLDANKLLSEFDGDARDFTQLPYSEKRAKKRPSELGARAEDPTTKRGLVGAFCRTYDIHTAIAEFLPDVYAESATPSANPRYTYVQGSGSNGAIVYDDGQFLFSQHGTDPCGEMLVNAFDMVRLHRYGGLDKGKPENTSPTNLPSYQAFAEMLEYDKAVMDELASSQVSAAAFEDIDDEDDEDLLPGDDDDDFDDLLGPEPDREPGGISDADFEDIPDDDDDAPAKPKTEKKKKKEVNREWAKKLTYDSNGKLEKTMANANRIVCNDARIAPCFAKNELSGAPHMMKLLNFPECELHQEAVQNRQIGRPVSDTDTAALSVAASEQVSLGGYGTEFSDRALETAVLQAAQKNVFNPIKDNMEKEEWDGVPRVDSFFIDFFDAEDTPYHRECGRIFFLGAVLRTYEPGCPFRQVIVLEGAEDIGKSGAIQVLAFDEYSTTLSSDFKDKKELVEQQRNAFLVELGEMSSMNRSSVEDVKRHLSETKDTVRLAYRRNEELFKRRCCFVGTTNLSSYLKDASSNTRFLPVKCRIPLGKTVDFKLLTKLRYQLWAEALHRYRETRAAQPAGALIIKLEGEEALAQAQELRETARVILPQDQAAEVIQEWIDREVPLHETRGSGARFLDDDEEEDDSPRYRRVHVSVAMVQQELASDPIIRGLRGSPANIISDALKSLPEWDKIGQARRGGTKAHWYARKGAKTNDLWEEVVDPDADLLG